MSVSGLCEICEAAEIEDQCDRCGRLVCADHYDRDTGLCTDCAAEVGRQPDRSREDRDRDYPDGVGEYEF
jgi:hypothetical protein